MKVTCIVPAAGKGKRLKSGRDKVFVNLGGEPLLSRTLKALHGCPFIDSIIVVVSANKIKSCERLARKYGLKKVKNIIRGGRRRFDSVREGLKEAKDTDFVLIHDGARPFIEQDLVAKVFGAAKKYGAALCATPSKQTLKSVTGELFVDGTPERKYIWEAQTPQAFRRDLIVKAYRKARKNSATDDAMLVERLGHRVKIVQGSPRNIKITTPEDLKLAEALIRNR